MESIPVPSPIHYELILQMLERQTMFAASQKPEIKEKVRQLIVTLRKAVALQKQIEESCEYANLPIEYRWSINHVKPQITIDTGDLVKSDSFKLQQELP